MVFGKDYCCHFIHAAFVIFALLSSVASFSSFSHLHFCFSYLIDMMLPNMAAMNQQSIREQDHCLLGHKVLTTSTMHHLDYPSESPIDRWISAIVSNLCILTNTVLCIRYQYTNWINLEIIGIQQRDKNWVSNSLVLWNMDANCTTTGSEIDIYIDPYCTWKV